MLYRDCTGLDMILNKTSFAISFFLFLADKTDDELEMTMVCHRPEGLEQLEAQTNFTKQELQILYRGFKNVIHTFLFYCKTTLVHILQSMVSF